MQSGNQDSFLNISQKSIIVLILTLTIIFLFLFRNLFFKSTFILKNFGASSIDPEIALNNHKPTFLEFYAEWCEVCKAMANDVSLLKDEYQKDIDFVFLNVDNPKCENYIRKYDVNGIPQINLFDQTGNLEATFIGKQEENTIKGYLESLNDSAKSKEKVFNSDFSLIKENKNYQSTPRSHS